MVVVVHSFNLLLHQVVQNALHGHIQWSNMWGCWNNTGGGGE